MLICQSCGMDISSDEHKGTNADKSLSEEYRAFCFKDGKFSNNFTLEEQMEIGLAYSPEYSSATTQEEKDKIKQQTREYLSNLKRWKNG